MKDIPTLKEIHQKYAKHNANGIIHQACDFLAVYPAKILLHTSITPNQITLLWIAIKIGAALVLLTGNYVLSLGAILLFQLASILDGSDGIVARCRKHYSLNGIYLDLIGHHLCNTLLIFTIALGIYRNTGEWNVLLPAAIGIFAYLFSKALMINPEWYTNEKQQKDVSALMYAQNLSFRYHQETTIKSKMLIAVWDFLRIDNPFNFMFWAILFKIPVTMLWVYAVLLALEMFRKVGMQWWRIYQAEH